MSKAGQRALPVLLALIGLLALAMLWSALTHQQELQTQRALDSEVSSLARAAETVMEERMRSLGRMGIRWEAGGGTPEPLWRRDARSFVADLPGTTAVEWADAEGFIRWIEPLAGNEKVLGLNLNRNGVRRQRLDAAQRTGRPTATPVFDLAQGGRGFLVFVPVQRNGRPDGTLVTVFRIEAFAPMLFPKSAREELGLELSEAGRPIASVGQHLPFSQVAARSRAPIHFAGGDWQVEAQARPGYGAAALVVTRSLVAAGGLIVLGLLIALCSLMLTVQNKNRALAAANLELEAGIEDQRRVRAELEFRQFALDQAAIVAITDAAGRITDVNERFVQISGYGRDELIGADHRILNSGYHAPEFFAAMWATISSGRVWRGTIRNKAKNGAFYWVDSTITPRCGPDGRPVSYMAIRIEVTLHKQVEEALRSTSALQRAILDNAAMAIIATDADGLVTHFNPAAERLLGYAAEEVVARATPAIWHLPEEVAARAASLSASLGETVEPGFETFVARARRGLREESEWTYVRRDGSQVPVLLGVSALRSRGGAITGWLGVALDMTQRREAEAAIRRANALMASAGRIARLGSWEIELASGQGAYSDITYEIFGMQAGTEIPLDRALQMYHDGDRAKVVAAIERAVSHGEPWELEVILIRGDGSERWVRARGEPVFEGGKVTRLRGVLQDIDGEMRSQIALRDRQAMLSAIIENVPGGVSLIDSNLDLVACNSLFKRVLALPETLFEHSMPTLEQIFRFNALRGDYGPGDVDALVSDRLALTRKMLPHRFERVRPDGTVLEISGTPLPSGGFVTFYLDITERRQQEEELRRHRDHLRDLVAEQTADLTQAKLAAEQASAAKSEFLANISHELRTPMHAILSFARLGRDRVKTADTEKLKNYFERISTSGDRLMLLINDLLDLSKLEAGRMTLDCMFVDLAGVAREVIHDLEPLSQAKQLGVELRAGAGDLVAEVDALRITQVLRNLLANAIKFTPAGRKVTVVIEAEDGARNELGVPAVEVRVEDEGVGIPEQELDAVFEKFVQSSTTRTGAGGTGLGLAICREIVVAHRGCIRAYNRLHGGAVFEMLLPRNAAGQVGEAAADAPVAGESLLSRSG
ncbi:hypothetical protein GCM10025771_26510 [Niveibacterium umoris]|uniref:histidine kinase n=1 Tax=Niveibacterium umoris TaxID=1193620 RepID=A0A840BGQ1_9RHOO|nr:PAS domain S-box protein [Niveibacterium umoris]MBB4012160.1 PAS domain S-box-containing protein [Niveibacterium umoris]